MCRNTACQSTATSGALRRMILAVFPAIAPSFILEGFYSRKREIFFHIFQDAG
jgi:hypothetical protein